MGTRRWGCRWSVARARTRSPADDPSPLPLAGEGGRRPGEGVPNVATRRERVAEGRVWDARTCACSHEHVNARTTLTRLVAALLGALSRKRERGAQSAQRPTRPPLT